jgi:hypothetical protein
MFMEALASPCLRQRILTIPSKLRTSSTDTPTNFLKFQLYCLQASVHLSYGRNNWLTIVLATPVHLERPKSLLPPLRPLPSTAGPPQPMYLLSNPSTN